MQSSTSSVNIATIMLIGMIALVILSLLTLAIYFFGGQSPFERNARGRIEAAVSPAEVLNSQRQYARLRFLFTVALIAGLYLVMYGTAKEQTEQATNLFFQAVSITLRAAKDGAVTLAQELGIGNECECADPSRIGRNGP